MRGDEKTTRAQVEQVLLNNLGTVRFPGQEESALQLLVTRLCDLLAPVSQPSRETLRELLHIYRYQSHDMHDGLPCPTCETFAEKLMAWATPHPLRREDLDALWEKHSCQEIATGEWRQIIKDAIWRWVCGEREHPHDAWCPHITWDRGEQRWVLNDKPDESYLIVQENWTVCPVCGKERPAPRPATPREA